MTHEMLQIIIRAFSIEYYVTYSVKSNSGDTHSFTMFTRNSKLSRHEPEDNKYFWLSDGNTYHM